MSRVLASHLTIASLLALWVCVANSVEPNLTWACHDQASNTDSLELWLPLPGRDTARHQRLLKNVTAKSDRAHSKSVIVSLCEGLLLVTARRNGTGHENVIYMIELSWDGGRNATDVWLYWPYAVSKCSTGKHPHPGLILVAEGNLRDGGNLKVNNNQGSKVTMYVQNIEAAPFISITLGGGEIFQKSQFAKSDQWYKLELPSAVINERGIKVDFTDTAPPAPSNEWYNAPFGSSNIGQITECHAEFCSNPGNVGSGKSSITVSAFSHKIWLAVILCAAILIAIGIATSCRSMEACSVGRDLGHSARRTLRVALTGGAGFLGSRSLSRHLRRSLAAEPGAAAPMTFSVTGLDDLRLRSSEFDLVLMFLAPDDVGHLTPEQRSLLEMERWRFRVLLLMAGGANTDAAAFVEDAEAQQQQQQQQPMLPQAALLGNLGVGVRVVSGGGGARWPEELATTVREACREAAARRREMPGRGQDQ